MASPSAKRLNRRRKQREELEQFNKDISFFMQQFPEEFIAGMVLARDSDEGHNNNPESMFCGTLTFQLGIMHYWKRHAYANGNKKVRSRQKQTAENKQ